jgi:hypothetical protein
MLFFANSEYREQKSVAAQVSQHQLGTLADLKELFSFLVSKLALLLGPTFILQGLTAAFTSGIVPSLIGPDDGGPQTITIYFLIHATCATIAARLTSRLYELRGGWALITLVCAVTLAFELTLTTLLVHHSLESSRKIALAFTAVSAGTFDSALNALISCTLMRVSRSGPRPLLLFASYRFISCLLGFVPLSLVATLTKPQSGEGFAAWWSFVGIGIGGWFLVFAGTFAGLNLKVVGLEGDDQRLKIKRSESQDDRTGQQ